MPWIQIALDAPDELKDAIVGTLAELEIGGVWESGEPRPGETRLIVYLEQPGLADGVERAIHSLFERNGRSAPAISRISVDERDWNEEWKKTYTSFPIAESFFVIPSWRNETCPEGRMPIEIDPGQAFGSGVHETTQMVMEAMEQLAGSITPHTVVLDVGAGSGILAIAARMLGAGHVIACDVDPIAVSVAAANAQRNGQSSIAHFCGSLDAIHAGSINLMLVNLTSDTIARLFSEIDRTLAPLGLVIFSGILSEQGEDIRALAQNLRYVFCEQIARGEWIALAYQKHGA